MFVRQPLNKTTHKWCCAANVTAIKMSCIKVSKTAHNRQYTIYIVPKQSVTSVVVSNATLLLITAASCRGQAVIALICFFSNVGGNSQVQVLKMALV